MKTRITAALLSSLATFLYSTAHAQTASETVTLLPTDDGMVQDGQLSPFDDFPDVVDSEFVVVQLVSAEEAAGFLLVDNRGVMEFDLSSLAGRNVRQAVLKLRLLSGGAPDGTTSAPIEVRQYKGNGVVGLTDFHRGAFATAFDMRLFTLSNLTVRVDITKAVRNALLHQWTYLGLTMRTKSHQAGVSLGSLEHPPSSSLVITFD
jgi:hypothetical protein